MKNLKKKDLLQLILFMGLRIDKTHINSVRERTNEVLGDMAPEPIAGSPKKISLLEVELDDDTDNGLLLKITNPLRNEDQSSLHEYVPKMGCTIHDFHGRLISWFCAYDDGSIDYNAFDKGNNTRRYKGTHEEMNYHWKINAK